MLALDRRFGFASAVAVLMLVQVLALDRFGFAGAAAVLMLVQVRVLQWIGVLVLRALRRADAGIGVLVCG